MAFKSCTSIVLICCNITRKKQSNGLQYLTRAYNAHIGSRDFVRISCWGQERPLTGLRENMSRRNSNCRYSSSCLGESGPKVKHDPEEKRFLLDVDGLGRAYLEYEREDQLIKILHTEVPQAFAGRGYGQVLAKEALEYVAKNDYQLEIHCEYVRNYVSKYAPKYIKYLK